MPRRLPLPRYVEGVLAGDRMLLARAITVIESNLPSDAELAAHLLDALLPHTGKALRVGITGVPGVGKSTFIDALGMYLIAERSENVAVLSVDPSSAISGGSILGDKTRMARLAVAERAFIRPSPSQGHLGGVARRTRETILLCEAAGYRNILVETVGVGQSETADRSMTDFFLLLMLAGAGDELQGMKRGIIEMLDGMAINKADGDNTAKAERARIEYAGALHLLPASADGWTPRVLTCSAIAKEGIAEIWRDDRARSSATPRSQRQPLPAPQSSVPAVDERADDARPRRPVPHQLAAVAGRLPRLREERAPRTHDPVRRQPRTAGPLPASTRYQRFAKRDLMRFPFPILTAAEAASLIDNGQNVGFSGFTPAGAPKAVPMAWRSPTAQSPPMKPGTGVPRSESSPAPPPARRSTARSRRLKAMKFRTPYQTDSNLRDRINAGKTRFFDLHLRR